jgi:hypothetical protein
MTILELEQYVLSGVFIIVWFLLRQKDARQQKEFDEYKAMQEKLMAKLFEIHDRDVRELSDLKLQIASNHYEAKTIDIKFEKLETTFKDGFRELGAKFDKFFDMYTDHLTNGTGKFPTYKP